MKRLIRTAGMAGLVGCVLAALALAGTAWDDDGPAKGSDVQEDDGPRLPETLVDPRQAAQEEMKELFRKVEQNLARIDVQLGDAGAGQVPLEAVPDSGLDDLLRSAGDNGQQVVSDIDKILELAKQLGGGT